jgi:xanthine dehydrogenase molybdopterin-binding subunit B
VTTTQDAKLTEFEDNDQKPIGFGRMLRKEDARLLRGRGRFVDDVQLPGMLHLAILRSPFAHATIVSIDTSAAEASPGVKAVVTGETLKGLGLAWMPTLSNDVQAVLATDKVRFQGQEVAFVVAEDRYQARSSVPTSRARRTTTSSTGRPATRPRPTGSSPPPTSSSKRTSSTRACTPRRWRPAARSPTSTRSRAS